eukprot:CAMPEP_0197592286 /NCGR_PEP_ID=MMETSP1326-20131121/15011_1 /TAXON_ID=1155430 /ORGANISM="Genus nov. species nov., Strain RCC2288" /LENGTH=227 /DNA_ID=CAMNT_0043157971 /DNA_START=123 /DNA_END=806 /DNA_ORIENTATION=-
MFQRSTARALTLMSRQCHFQQAVCASTQAMTHPGVGYQTILPSFFSQSLEATHSGSTFASQPFITAAPEPIADRQARLLKQHTDDVPLLKAIGDAFGPTLDAIADAIHTSKSLPTPEDILALDQVYAPYLPPCLPVTRWARDNDFLRSVLIVDDYKRLKPRLTWYDPCEKCWVPDDWFTDGVVGDMKYYFGDASMGVSGGGAADGGSPPPPPPPPTTAAASHLAANI